MEKYISKAEQALTFVGAGLVTVDIIQEVSSEWRPLEKPAVYSSGGTVCNILCHLAHAGWNAQVVGAVGEDELGKVVRADLQHFGVDCSALLAGASTPTRRILHKIVSDGTQIGKHKFELSCPKCGRSFLPVSPPPFRAIAPLVKAIFDKGSVLIVDRANELTAELVDRVAGAGGTVIFEPGYLPTRSTELVWKILKRVNVLKYSAELVWNRQPFSKILHQSSVSHINVVIETRGQHGVQITRGNRRKRLVAQPLVTVRDGAGAGDAFMAGFLLGLGADRLHELRGVTDFELEAAVGRGQARGGLACAFLGSKGLLYNHTHEQIETAVSDFSRTLAVPKGFGSDILRGTPCVDAVDPQSCPVCRLK